ncbi:MAG: FAD-dependent oxidoreductase [Hungatella hathewayi]|nr:FAD-dependent oxidoreductase [Hungatella hathewayi]
MEFQVCAKELNDYDVLVAGGGPAGIGAAVAAARGGAKTLLIESMGCVGGTGTIGALPFWLGATTGSIPYYKMLEKGLAYSELPHPRKAVGGIFEEAMSLLRSEKLGVGPAVIAQTERYPGLDRLGCHDEFTYDLEGGKRVLEQMILSSGAEILYFTHVVGVEVQNRILRGVFVSNKEGISYIKAKRFVDTTGDGDVAAYGGFETYKGDRTTGQMTSASLVCHIEHVDSARFEVYLNEGGDPWLRGACRKAQQEHPEANLNDSIIMFPMMQDGVFMINGGTAFHFMDGTSAADISRIMQLGRMRAYHLIEYLFKPYVPGFEHATLRLCASYPGIRETRRIVGEYTLIEEDALNGTEFSDTIALAGRHFDLGRVKKREDGTLEYVQPTHKKELKLGGGFMQIPYRALIPKNSYNLIVAGRCIAADGQTMGPARIMSTCMATGEAAGTAAAMTLKQDCGFKQLDTQLLKAQLKHNRAIID